MMKQTSRGIFPILAILLIVSCESTKDKERPSPLRSDSVTVNSSNLKIEFGSPAVRERVIWGGLESYGEIWRTGANEATRLTTTKRIKINGIPLDSGKYSLFTIPRINEWTFILNENYKQWGTYDYDSTLDVLRMIVIPEKSAKYSERMKFYFENDSLKFHWENLQFSLSIE